jgi:hypothetical protein
MLYQMETKDNIIASLNDSIQEELMPLFLDKQTIFIEDNNGSSDYAINMSKFETATLSNSGMYHYFKEGYMVFPMVATLVSDVDLDLTQAKHSMILKSHEAILSSLEVRLQQRPIQQVTPYQSLYNTFKKHTTFSLDDININGDLVGYKKHTSDAFYKDSVSGLRNDKMSLDGAVEDADGFIMNQSLKCDFVYTDAHKTEIINDTLREAHGVNYLKKVNAGVGGGADDGKSWEYHFTSVIRLRDVCDFFDKAPMLRGALVEITCRFNQVKNYVLDRTANNCGIASFNLTGDMCPFMRGSTDKDLAEARKETYALQVGSIGNKTGVLTRPRLYLPAYIMSPEYESRFIEDPQRKILYTDTIGSLHTAVKTGSFSINLTNSASDIARIIVIPMLNKEFNGTQKHNPLHTPFTTELPTPSLISNVNLKISGSNLYQNPVDYNFENFLHEMNNSSGTNANMLQGMTSGQISLYDFNNMYKYYVFDVSRKADFDTSTPASYTLTGTIQGANHYDFYVFMEQNKSVTVNLVTSVVLD